MKNHHLLTTALLITIMLVTTDSFAQQLRARTNDTTTNHLMLEPLGTNFGVFLGQNAGRKNVGFGNVFIGNAAGYTNTSGDQNIYIGPNAGNKLTTSSFNTIIGGYAGNASLSGGSNTFLGQAAGNLNTTGSNNTFLGRNAGASNVLGSGNVFLGHAAGQFEAGGNRLYIHNSSANKNNALIYGEFDNKLLTVNGQLGLGRPAENDYWLTMQTISGGIQNHIMVKNILGSPMFQVMGNNVVHLSKSTELGIGTLSPEGEIHIKQTGGALLIIESDDGNTNETNNPQIEFRQDGGLTSTFLGYNENVYGSNNFGISTDQAQHALIISNSGNVGIGTDLTPDGNMASGHRLSVNGKIAATEVRIQLQNAWPDYVFAPEYELLPLDELQKSIDKNNHLPNIPSAEEVEAEGIQVGDMQTRMMEKIEELTLYILELHEEIKTLKKKID